MLMGLKGVVVAGVLALAGPVEAMEFRAMDAAYTFDSQEGMFSGVGWGHDGVEGRLWVQVVEGEVVAGQWSVGDRVPEPVLGLEELAPLEDDGVVDRWELRFRLDQDLAWWAWVGAGPEGPFGASYQDRVVPLHSYLVTTAVPLPPRWVLLGLGWGVLWWIVRTHTVKGTTR